MLSLSLYHVMCEKVTQELCDWSKSSSSNLRCEQTRVKTTGLQPTVEKMSHGVRHEARSSASSTFYTQEKVLLSLYYPPRRAPWRNDFLAGIPIITPCRPVHMYRLLVECPPNRPLDRWTEVIDLSSSFIDGPIAVFPETSPWFSGLCRDSREAIST